MQKKISINIIYIYTIIIFFQFSILLLLTPRPKRGYISKNFFVITARYILLFYNLFTDSFFYFSIQGTSVKFNPQRVGPTHVMQHEDIIQIISK